MIALYCTHCETELEVLESDDTMVRTLICPKCGKEYACTLREIKDTTPTNLFYKFQCNNLVKCVKIWNARWHYWDYTYEVYIEANDKEEAKNILLNLLADESDIKFISRNGNAICVPNIEEYIEAHVDTFSKGRYATLIYRNGNIKTICN
jgi:hypothetical protein